MHSFVAKPPLYGSFAEKEVEGPAKEQEPLKEQETAEEQGEAEEQEAAEEQEPAEQEEEQEKRRGDEHEAGPHWLSAEEVRAKGLEEECLNKYR